MRQDLVIISDFELPDAIRDTLAQDYDLSELTSAGPLREQIEEAAPDVILLVLKLEDADALRLIRDIRDQNARPIMLIGDQVALDFYIDALDSGADDFLCQNLSEGVGSCVSEDFPEELRARLRKLLRLAQRSSDQANSGELVCGELVMFTERRRAVYAGHMLELTKTEYRLLKRLLRDAGEVIEHETLLRDLWGEHFVKERRYLRVYINRLRDKLGEKGGNGLIETIKGQGYRLLMPSQRD